MAETLHKSDLKDKNGENNGRKAGIDRWTQYFEQGIFRDPGSDEFGRTAHECSLWILNIMFKILEEEQPDYLTVAFDVSEPTFRHKMFAEYKGTRKPMAQELREQVPLMKEMLKAMGVTTIEKGGYEADDLLGTIAKQSEQKGLTVSVVSGDRDLLQLATDHIKIRIPKTKRTGTEIEDYNAAEVKEKYQVTPIEFIDVKALMGIRQTIFRECRESVKRRQQQSLHSMEVLKMPMHMWTN